MMKRNLFAVAAAFAAVVCTAEEESIAELAPANPGVKVFTTLPCCSEVSGEAEVRVPGSEEWVAAENGKFYPLGSQYRVSDDGVLVLAFGPDCSAKISGDADFGTRAEALDATTRTVVLGSGELSLKLPMNLKEGAMTVAAPGFVAKNLAGESKFVRTDLGDGDEVTVRCVTGAIAIDGRHFAIPAMDVADEVRIRSSHDFLETFLCGNSGDYIVRIDQGVTTTNKIMDDGEMKSVTEKSVLDWHLSPKTKVRIDRRAPAIGEHLAVSVMTFDAMGNMKNQFAFTEGRAEVNSGEQVSKTKEEKEEMAKAAAAAEEEAASKKAAEEDDEEEE